MLIVADTGPLISLAVIDKLDLLDTLFYDVVIPEAVWQELENNIEELSIPQAGRFQNNVVPVTNYREINADLDPGEKEAILLYEEIHADRLLVEDKDARLFAETRGIRCTGTIGVLIESKHKGLIPCLRPIFAKLLVKNRYYSALFLNEILALCNEKTL
jgi:predicted nucleic acid-binding protein